jgi:hypothetical protein
MSFIDLSSAVKMVNIKKDNVSECPDSMPGASIKIALHSLLRLSLASSQKG